jgi:hypothetical protein
MRDSKKLAMMQVTVQFKCYFRNMQQILDAQNLRILSDTTQNVA